MTFPINLCNEVVRTLDFRCQCAFARAVGYNGLEVAPFTLSPTPHELTASAIREYRAIADGEGIPIAGLHWLLAAPEGLSITSADEDVGQNARDRPRLGQALRRARGALPRPRLSRPAPPRGG
ncbi:hypothetical protein MesoLjLc_75490 [Mesorhizobium sp. L-8-10]|uniref:hypothetical protein n=1 Tax=Mesorhizobium sp. L-8-10 TaxID=2744523 RepID=UPI0019277FAB|nr:hypothetical protein [Mesorhizobium sp. L-8-10]BCH35619.1 hypothetical protein MesoLjLc_75490 [Mesorhizobium sp. L-8-10]